MSRSPDITTKSSVPDMKTTLTIDENGILTFPDELMEELGWMEGDVLEWNPNDDGSFTLVKIENA